MTVLTIRNGTGRYPVYIGRGLLREAGRLLPLDRRVLLLTDDGVPAEYAQTLVPACKEAVVMTLPQGEENKSPAVWLSVLDTLLSRGFGRGDCVLTVGGGVVGDLGGFAAACYMRGIGFCQVPTTLLAQVDASVGGKTALDYGGCKNVLGAFYPPEAVLVDPDVLRTLDGRQFACGMAEIIKMAATHDAGLFALLEDPALRLPGDEAQMQEIITASLKIKQSVVEADEKESGLRRVLNFGHTVGHAVEAATAKGAQSAQGTQNAQGAQSGRPLLHGECVGLGMLCVTRGEVRARIARLLEKYGLPTTCAVYADALTAAMTHDKKTMSDGVCVVRVPEIGSFTFENTTAESLSAESREVLTLT